LIACALWTDGCEHVIFKLLLCEPILVVWYLTLYIV